MAQSNYYADTKIAELIDGAPETLDTLKEIADALAENDTVMEVLNAAIGTKANQTELDTHTENDAIHVTQYNKNDWNEAKEHADSPHARTDATKVEKSDINGNIKINGIEINVYTPSDETKPQGNSDICYSDAEPLILFEGMTWIGNEEEENIEEGIEEEIE